MSTNAKPKAKQEFVLREGFWWSAAEENARLPRVRARPNMWRGQKRFLAALAKVETSEKVTEQAYRGWSTCRCCGKKNGSTDFTLELFGITWTWPAGYSHYVAEHNVRTSLAFQEFIMAASEAV